MVKCNSSHVPKFVILCGLFYKKQLKLQGCMAGKNPEDFVAQFISVSLMQELYYGEIRWLTRRKWLSVISSAEKPHLSVVWCWECGVGVSLTAAIVPVKKFLCDVVIFYGTLHSRVCLSASTFWLLIFGAVTQS